MDDAAGIGDAAGDRPTVDTVGICIRCAGIGIYTMNPDGETLGLRLATPAEKVALSEYEEIQKVRAVVEKMNLKGWYEQ
jgi:hypothetical protein